MKLKTIAILLSFAGFTSALIGCAGSTTFMKTGDASNATPRDPQCDFKVFTTTPSDSFKEVGTIRFYARTIDQVKKAAQKDVCHAGGDGLIVAPLSTDGYYESATVILLK
jgi:hypothetical protein